MKELGLLMEVLPIGAKLNLESFAEIVYYSYFQVNGKNYIFIYAKSRILKEIIKNLLSTNFTIINNITGNQRSFRSLRGFCLYSRDLQKTEKGFTVMDTNLNPKFWENIELILYQKNKSKLEQYLFNFNEDEGKFNSASFILKNFENPLTNKIEVNSKSLIFFIKSKANKFPIKYLHS